MGCSFRDSADNLSFSIVGLTYNPDHKEKYFYKYYDTSLYAQPPTDDDLFEYTAAKELLSDPDILFLQNTPPAVVETPDAGPSARPSLNLVPIGFVRPDVCPTKDTIFLPGKPRAQKSPPASPTATRSQFSKKTTFN